MAARANNSCDIVLQLMKDSQLCRLCGQNNPIGQFLNQDITTLVNNYLPLKIGADSPYPRWICPGCHLQVESTVEFFDLVATGQEYLRALLVKQNSLLAVVKYESQSENVDNRFYKPNDKIVKRVTGSIDKPKRRRGRPSRPPQDVLLAQQREADEKAENEKRLAEMLAAAEADSPGRKRRNIKKPSRFKEVVQGNELERIYVEEGVIEKSELLHEPTKVVDATDIADYSPDVIGHLQTDKGHNLGNVVCDSLFRPSRKTKYYCNKRKIKFICDICDREFLQETRFLEHRASHHVQYECIACESKFFDQTELVEHQQFTLHTGQGIIEMLDETDVKPTFCDTDVMVSATSMMTNESADDMPPPLMPIEVINLPPAMTSELISESDSNMANDQSNVEEAAKVLYELQNMDKFAENSIHSLLTQPGDVNFVDQTQNILLLKSEHSMIGSMDETAENGILNGMTSPGDEVVNETLFGECGPSPKPNERHDCAVCNKTFSSITLHDTHYYLVHGPDAEQEPKANHNKRRSKMITDEAKTNVVMHKFQCNKCSRSFRTSSAALYHRDTEHNVGRKFVCNKCSKVFKHKQLLQRHQLVHSSDRPYPCDACGASFKTKPNLLNHQQIHTGVKNHECNICRQTFAHKTSLKLHYRWHSGSKPFSCEVCGKTFAQNGNLQEHMRIHTGERPFECAYCGKKFKTSSQNRIHSKRHQKNKPYECSFCRKQFIYLEVYRAHLRRHNNDKPYVCSYCSKKFSEQWALRKHIRIHTGEKPYPCSICSKSFSDCSNLTKHKKIHENQDIVQSKSIVVPPETDIDKQSITNDGDTWNIGGKDGESSKNVTEVFYVTYQNRNNPSGSRTQQMANMPDGLDETSTISIVDKDSEYILGGNSEFQAEITYGDKDNVASANTDQAIIFSKPISQNVEHTSTEPVGDSSALLDNIYGQSFEIITTDGRKLRLLAQYPEQLNPTSYIP